MSETFVALANAPNLFVAVQQAAWRALNAKPLATTDRGEEMVEEVL